MKKFLSVILAVIVLASTMTIPLIAYGDEGHNATLGFANSDWSVQEWGENVNTTVTGFGEYTLSWDLPEGAAIADALVFVVDVAGAGAENYQLASLTVTADGKEIPVDLSKVVTGDLEDNGNFRIEIYNEYGTTKGNAPINNVFTAEKNLTVTFTLEERGFAAKLGFANSDWSVQEWGENVNTKVTGPGEYTLSWDLPEDTAIADELVFVVDVAGAAAEKYQLAGLTITADGAEVPVDLSKVVTGDLEENGNFRIEIYNEYGATKADAPISNTFAVEKNLTVTFTLEEESFVTTLGFANSDWSVQEWGENVSTKVAGPGEYALSWDLPEGTAIGDALVFVVDVQACGNHGYKLTGLTVTADGAEIPVDLSKVVTGDVEEKGNFRIEIYNEYGATKADAPINNVFTAEKNLTVTFTVDVEEVPEVVLVARTAKLKFNNAEWSVTEFGDTVNTTVEGAGEYTLSWDLPGAIADVSEFAIDVEGAGADGYSLVGLTVTADGNEVPVDQTKVLSGDLEDRGNFRIEIYNEYGATANDAPIDPALAAETNLTVTFTLDAEAGPTGPVFDPSASYNAYLGLQTPNWTYRDAWNSANGIDSENWGSFIYGNETKEKYGVVTDAAVAGNGTYTVSVTDFGTVFADDFAAAGQEWFNLLYVSTDIPLSEDVKITDVTLLIDGKAVHKYAEYYQNPDESEYVSIQVQNIWNADIKEISYYAAPAESLEISFTISGFNYDA